jgi:mannose-6-phosphate isomerase-like protein (cupin superfamily)
MSKQIIQRVEKPWGHELIWAKTADYVGKILHIRKGHMLSLQYHRQKEETVLVSSGKMLFLFEDEKGVMQEIPLSAGEAHHIPTGRKHRMIAVEDCDVFEVSTPQLDDVVRIEDGYGRAPVAPASHE